MIEKKILVMKIFKYLFKLNKLSTVNITDVLRTRARWVCVQSLAFTFMHPPLHTDALPRSATPVYKPKITYP